VRNLRDVVVVGVVGVLIFLLPGFDKWFLFRLEYIVSCFMTVGEMARECVDR